MMKTFAASLCAWMILSNAQAAPPSSAGKDGTSPVKKCEKELTDGKTTHESLALHLKLSTTHLEKAIAQTPPSEQQQLTSLFEQAKAYSNPTHLGLVSAYVRILSEGVGAFSVRPKEIQTWVETWPEANQKNLTEVLLDAARKLESKQTLGREEAFEKALKDRGLLEKYLKGCRA